MRFLGSPRSCRDYLQAFSKSIIGFPEFLGAVRRLHIMALQENPCKPCSLKQKKHRLGRGGNDNQPYIIKEKWQGWLIKTLIQLLFWGVRDFWKYSVRERHGIRFPTQNPVHVFLVPRKEPKKFTQIKSWKLIKKPDLMTSIFGVPCQFVWGVKYWLPWPQVPTSTASPHRNQLFGGDGSGCLRATSPQWWKQTPKTFRKAI